MLKSTIHQDWSWWESDALLAKESPEWLWPSETGPTRHLPYNDIVVTRKSTMIIDNGQLFFPSKINRTLGNNRNEEFLLENIDLICLTAINIQKLGGILGRLVESKVRGATEIPSRLLIYGASSDSLLNEPRWPLICLTWRQFKVTLSKYRGRKMMRSIPVVFQFIYSVNLWTTKTLNSTRGQDHIVPRSAN